MKKKEEKKRKKREEIKQREEEKRKRHEEELRYLLQEHADEVVIMGQIHAHDWKNFREVAEKMMQEEGDDTKDSSTDDATSNEDEDGEEKSPGTSQDTSGSRIVREDPNGIQISLSGQDYVNFKIQVCDKGNKEKGGNDKDEKEGWGKWSSGASVTLHGSYNHDVNNVGGRKEQGTKEAVVINYRQGLKKWDGSQEYEVKMVSFGVGTLHEDETRKTDFGTSGTSEIPGKGRDAGNGYDGDEEGIEGFGRKHRKERRGTKAFRGVKLHALGCYDA